MYVKQKKIILVIRVGASCHMILYIQIAKILQITVLRYMVRYLSIPPLGCIMMPDVVKMWNMQMSAWTSMKYGVAQVLVVNNVYSDNGPRGPAGRQ